MFTLSGPEQHEQCLSLAVQVVETLADGFGIKLTNQRQRVDWQG
jgi:hypothetical protein